MTLNQHKQNNAKRVYAGPEKDSKEKTYYVTRISGPYGPMKF